MTATGSTEALGNFAFGAAVTKDMSFNHTTWAGEPLGAVTSAYSIINGSLPPGLSFDTATAIISGTLTVETSNTVYFYSNEFSSGYVSSIFNELCRRFRHSCCI